MVTLIEVMNENEYREDQLASIFCETIFPNKYSLANYKRDFKV